MRGTRGLWAKKFLSKSPFKADAVTEKISDVTDKVANLKDKATNVKDKMANVTDKVASTKVANVKEAIPKLSAREIRGAYDKGALASFKVGPSGEKTYEMTKDLPEITLTDKHVSESNRQKARLDTLHKENPLIESIHGSTDAAAGTIAEAASLHPALSLGKLHKPLKVVDKLKKGYKARKLFKKQRGIG